MTEDEAKQRSRTFWDYVAASGGLYHMGPAAHLTYILDSCKELGAQSILDVGCGTAPVYDLIQRRLEEPEQIPWDFTYKGVDMASEMIRVAKEAFPKANLEVQDARHLNEADGSWDCVLLIDCLDHLDDYQAAIAEATRVAKVYVIVSLWRDLAVEGTNLNDRNMMNKEAGEEPWEDTHLQEYSKQALWDVFTKNKLEVIEVIMPGERPDFVAGRSIWILKT